MRFTKPWRTLAPPNEYEKRLPILDLRTFDGAFAREVFVVDSGADISLGPRRLCALIGLDWETGQPIELHGIAHRAECVVPGMIHPVEVYIRDAGCRVTIPFCFAEADAPLLLGRDGFFDTFRIESDKRELVTVFEPFDWFDG